MCNDATLSLGNAFILDTFHLWGDVIATETRAFDQFQITSVCNDLKVFYAAEYYDPISMGWYEVPSSDFEITFDANRRIFTADKCGPVSQIGDSECGTPFMTTKVYDVRVVATVNNMVMTQNRDLEFDITIGPDCSDNEVTLILPISNLDYSITPSASISIMAPLFKMSNMAGCALKCYLFETGIVPAGYVNPAIMSFDNLQGFIQISTNDISLHGT